MSSIEHERAAGLLAERAVEGIGQADEVWLQQHLAGCEECSGFANALGMTRQALCSIPVTASDELVSATKARVRIRALEMREHVARTALVSISVLIGAAISSVSLYYVWPLVRWLETNFHVPAIIAEPGVVVVWFAPTMIAAAFLAAFRSQSQAARNAVAQQEGMEGKQYVH